MAVLSPALEVSARPFLWFRLMFAAMMFPQVWSLTPFIHQLSESIIVFHYPYLDVINAYSHGLIHALEAVSLLGAVLLGLGIFPRVGAALFTAAFGYMFLIDMSFYNNHYYLWCLLGLLFLVQPRAASLPVWGIWRKADELPRIPISVYFPFAALITIVYFYGGLVKANPDWLQGYPMRLMTAARGWPMPDVAGLFLSYGGLLFDLGIGFLLWRKPLAWYVLLPYVFFHGSNFFTFNIGEFPLVMIAALLVFIPLGQTPWNVLKPALSHWIWRESGVQAWWYRGFFVFSLCWPWRSLWIGGNVAWHRQGYLCAWRMMLNNHESIYFQFLVEIPDKNERYWVQFDKALTARQYAHTYHDPYYIWLLAQKLKADAQKKYQSDRVHVYCKSVVMLNQHPPQPLIDQSADLGALPFDLWGQNSFVLPSP